MRVRVYEWRALYERDLLGKEEMVYEGDGMQVKCRYEIDDVVILSIWRGDI